LIVANDVDVAIEPPLSPAERVIVKSYGGWTGFLTSFGLKPWIEEDAKEGKKILESFAAQDQEQK
jgi:hypothetical protein